MCFPLKSFRSVPSTTLMYCYPGAEFICIIYYKVKYDRPGECSPEKDCLR